MQKRILAAAAVMGLLLFLFWMDSRQGDSATPSDQQTLPTVAERDGGRAVRSTQATTPTEPRAEAQMSAEPLMDLTVALEAQEELLVMYEEMVDAFDHNPGNCNRTAIAVEAVTIAHKPALQRWQAERAKMSKEDYRRAYARVQRAHGPKMTTLQHRIEQGMARCRASLRLNNAWKFLATMGADK